MRALLLLMLFAAAGAQGASEDRMIAAGVGVGSLSFSADGSMIAATCEDHLLRCLLESTPIYDVELERFLTGARFALLERAANDPGSSP